LIWSRFYFRVTYITYFNRTCSYRFIVFTLPNTSELAEINLLITETSLGELSGLILENPIITVNRSKEVIRTKVNGLDGEIIEIVTNGN
jgi:hypothetical protein